ncbi:MAG: choice-of-anchor L domain-containing protein [Candidatus Acidiferrales bacterium]
MRKLFSLRAHSGFLWLILVAVFACPIGVSAQVLRNAPPYGAHTGLNVHTYPARTFRAYAKSMKTGAMAALQGYGTVNIQSDLAPDAQDKVRLDGQTPPMILTLTNISEDTTVTFSGISTDNPDSFTVSTTCKSLSPGQSCTASITYTPVSLCDGGGTTITITDDDPEPDNDGDDPGTLEYFIQGYGSDNGMTLDDLTDTKLTPTALAQALVGQGVTVSNVTYTGANRAAGNFSSSSNIVGFNSGIVLSTGAVRDVIGPNCDSGITVENGAAGDSDLDTLLNEGNTGAAIVTNDAAVLEFDFVPTSSTVSFQYVFSSDEYNEFVFEFNDVFGFFLNGNNIALIPGTQTPVSINTVNNGNSTGVPDNPPVNPQDFVNNDFQYPAAAPLDFEMDGKTIVFSAQATVTPNQTNHIKLAIADAEDFDVDSNVFIKAGSFSSTDLTLTPVSQDFGSVAVGSSGQPVIFTLTNVGTEAVDLGNITTSAGFTQTNNCGDGLNPSGNDGSSCTIQVSFAPTAAGPATGTLTVNYNAAGSANNLTISSSLTGTGTGGSTTLTVAPTSLSFGSQVVNTTSPPQTITVTNTGTSSVTVSAVTAPAGFAQTNDCATLTTNASCTVNVTFKPTSATVFSGNVSITDTATGSPQTVVVSGTGTTATGTITVSPSSLTFTQVIGTTSPAQTVTITNTGTTSVAVSNVSVPATFAQTNNCTTVAASATCTINVTFTPTSTEPVNGSLMITDTATGSPHKVALTGTGVNSPIVISIPNGGSNTATSAPGGTAYYGLIITAVPGFTGTVQLGCTPSSPTITCSAVPSSITLSASGSTEVAFAIQTYCTGTTTNTGSIPAYPGGFGGGMALFMVTLSLAGATWTFHRKPRVALAFAMLLIVVLGGAACGGGLAKGPNGVTPAGTYYLTLNATTNGNTVSMPNFLKLIVN